MYIKLPDLKSLNDRQLAELQVEVLERTRKNTGAIAGMLGVIILLSAAAVFVSAMFRLI
jgi:hypothetical protein